MTYELELFKVDATGVTYSELRYIEAASGTHARNLGERAAKEAGGVHWAIGLPVERCIHGQIMYPTKGKVCDEKFCAYQRY